MCFTIRIVRVISRGAVVTHVAGAMGDRARTEDNPKASGAFGCCIERFEIAWTEKLGAGGNPSTFLTAGGLVELPEHI
eukprot:6926316-Pyramimonas_sp.AAC.1